MTSPGWMQKFDEHFNGRVVSPYDNEDKAITGTTLTASASAHTKGSWSQLVASAPFDIGMLLIATEGNSASGTDTSMLLDIGIGAAASEVVLLPDILAGADALQGGTDNFWVPIFIPEGTRIAGRIQAVIGSDTLVTKLGFWEAGGYPSYQYAENIGSLTASSSGTDIEGTAWVELKASTTVPIDALVGMVDMAGSTLGGNRVTNEIAIGAASSEVQIFPNINDAGTSQQYLWIAGSGSNESINEFWPRGPLPGIRRIPDGTRISMRQVTGSDRVDGAALLGLSGAVH